MTIFKTLRTNDAGAIRTIELNRPEALNALNGQMTNDLADAFREAGQHESVKVVVLTGAGRAFWAGADLKEPASARSRFGEMIEILIDFPKPFLIAVNGVGVGIGATVCGLADVVIMCDQARLRCPFSALGLTAEAGSTMTYSQLMGRQRASWFLLSSEWMSAEECVEAGLALEVVPTDQLLPKIMAKAETLAALPLASLVKTKSLIMDPVRERLKQNVMAENAGLAELRGGAANREALAAFREKRDPDFSGL